MHHWNIHLIGLSLTLIAGLGGCAVPTNEPSTGLHQTGAALARPDEIPAEWRVETPAEDLRSVDWVDVEHEASSGGSYRAAFARFTTELAMGRWTIDLTKLDATVVDVYIMLPEGVESAPEVTYRLEVQGRASGPSLEVDQTAARLTCEAYEDGVCLLFSNVDVTEAESLAVRFYGAATREIPVVTDAMYLAAANPPVVDDPGPGDPVVDEPDVDEPVVDEPDVDEPDMSLPGGCYHPFHEEPGRVYYTSRMGWRWGRCHNGLDLDGPTRIHALFSGQSVTYHASGYGRIIEISKGPWRVRYAHVTSPIAEVRAGGNVVGGQAIGFTAAHGTYDAGSGTGQHLHLEIFHGGSRVDPGRFLTETGLDPNAAHGTGCWDKTLPWGFARDFCNGG